MRKHIVIIPLLILLMGASFEKALNRGVSISINKVENTIDIPVVDYNKIKRAVSNFRFFPVVFYVSKDGCNTSADRLDKDSDLNIDICMGFNVIDGFHYLRVELITPDGSVYQSLNLFVDRAESPPKMIRFKNEHTFYLVTKPKIVNEISVVMSSLPVGGSVIQTQNLTGKWRADLYIDESKSPYGTCEFEIK